MCSLINVKKNVSGKVHSTKIFHYYRQGILLVDTLFQRHMICMKSPFCPVVLYVSFIGISPK